MQPIKLAPIGVVRSPVREPVDESWGSVISEIQLDPALAPGLAGIEQFSHLIVVFWLHRATFDAASELVRRPQGRADMPRLGIFAQRSKHRPNALALTAVRLLGVEGSVLRVQGLDAIDGTPVLDVKPYYPAYDRIDNATTPPWVEQLMERYF